MDIDIHQPRNMSAKRKKLLRSLIGQNPYDLLMSLSSTYSEQNEKEFKGDYGCSFKEAEEAMATLIYFLNH